MMDYSTWFGSSTMDISSNTNTLRLFDDSPVQGTIKRADSLIHHRHHHHPYEVATKLWVKDEAGALMEELNKVNEENKRLTETLTAVCENYNELKRQLADYMSKSASNEVMSEVTKKRKLEGFTNGTFNAIARNNHMETSSSDEEDSFEKPKEETLKTKITRVSVRTEASDSGLILKDGYQWRKYGQKVTKDNPCPRAYFKCSFAPSCPVKKKVQRSLEDQTTLVATYEGEHNHAPPAQHEPTLGTTRGATVGTAPCNTAVGSPGSGATVILDLTKRNSNNNVVANDTTKTLDNTNFNHLKKFNSPEFQELLAEQMASSLTKDPNFTAALAAAISGRIVQQSSSN